MNNAIVTVVTKDQYLISAIRFGQRLDYLNSKYELIILTDDNLKVNVIKYKSLIQNNTKIIYFSNFWTSLKVADKSTYYYKDTLNKFQALLLIEYTNLMYIDSDVLLFKNIDNKINFYFNKIKNPFLTFTTFAEDTPNVIDGSRFFLKPSRSTFDQIKKIIESPDFIFETDEQILNTHFSYCRIPTKLFYDDTCAHFAGYKKIWEFDGELHQLFYEKSYKEFNEILDLNQAQLKKIGNDYLELINSINIESMFKLEDFSLKVKLNK